MEVVPQRQYQKTRPTDSRPGTGEQGPPDGWERRIDDFDTATDDADFPQEWHMPLTLNLAVALAPKYGVPPAQYQMLAQQAAYWKEVAEGFDRECTVWFQPKRGFD